MLCQEVVQKECYSCLDSVGTAEGAKKISHPITGEARFQKWYGELLNRM